MTSITRQKLKGAGLQDLTKILAPAIKPSIRLTCGKPSAQAVSRLGGRPNLPKQIAWPEGPDGQPLSFIAQLDLAALPRIREVPLPRAGSLWFFYDDVEQPWGFDPKDRGRFCAIFDPSPLTASRPQPWPPDLDDQCRFRSLALHAAIEDSLPSFNHDVFRRGGPVAEQDAMAYMEFHSPLQQGFHRVGGNADEIQGPLAEQAQLVSNGFYCGDGTGYSKAKRKGFDARGGNWLLLLQVDSEDRTGMMFGDMGRLFFMIRRQDLVQLRFDDVWAILQCT